MISSRVQFGVYGAVIPIVLACLMYVGVLCQRLGARRPGYQPVGERQ